MCEVAARGKRLRWGRLYSVTLTPLAALVLVEAAAPPAPLRTVVRYGLGLAILAGMCLWIRANRVAFDLEQWCECAPRTITMRVIESRPAAPAAAIAVPEHAEAEPTTLIAV
jgi:hypothetical protein